MEGCSPLRYGADCGSLVSGADCGSGVSLVRGLNCGSRGGLSPALGADRVFEAFGGDEDCADVRFGEVADDVEGLEIMAELIVAADWDGEEQTEIIPAVERSRDRVDVQLFPQVENAAHERDTLDIDLRAEPAVAYKPFQRIAQAAVHEIAV